MRLKRPVIHPHPEPPKALERPHKAKTSPGTPRQQGTRTLIYSVGKVEDSKDEEIQKDTETRVYPQGEGVYL